MGLVWMDLNLQNCWLLNQNLHQLLSCPVAQQKIKSYLTEVDKKRMPVSLDPFWNLFLWVLPGTFLFSLHLYYIKFVLGDKHFLYSLLSSVSLSFLPARRTGGVPGPCPALHQSQLPALFGKWSQQMQHRLWQHQSLLTWVFNDASMSPSSFLHGSSVGETLPTHQQHPKISFVCLFLELKKKGRRFPL